MTVITDVKLNLYEINSRVDNATKTATTTLGIDITATDQLEYVMNRLRRMKGVYSVERAIASSGGLHK